MNNHTELKPTDDSFSRDEIAILVAYLTLNRRNQRKVANGRRGEREIAFKLTPYNNYDTDNKRLNNVALPIDNKHAISKEYLENSSSNLLVRAQVIDTNHKPIKEPNIRLPFQFRDIYCTCNVKTHINQCKSYHRLLLFSNLQK